MITISADSRRATATSDEPITTGSVGIPVHVLLSAEFDGLQAIVTFRAGWLSADVALTGQPVTVPAQCLAQAGKRLVAGVYGAREDGTIVIPTVWADVGMICEGATPSGVDPVKPTPSWAAQMQAMAREARDAVAGSLANRVSSLDGTSILAHGAHVEVVGIPAYVSDVSAYADYGITETGWYAFAKVTGPDGARVTSSTEVTGADGHIAIVGEDHVDVAVRFDVAAQSQVVIIDWGATQDTLVFRASDLAIRNLDYRVTFYVYDIADYATWTYALTTDETFVAGSHYYVLEEGQYVEATDWTAGDAVPAETYYKHSDGTISDTVTSYAPDDKPHAENKFHATLAAAAISDKPIHAVALMTAEGFVLESKHYRHEE